MIKIGTLDRITAVVGERGVGKSTFAKLDAKEFQRETGGYVIGHSPNGQIGWEEYIDFHDSIESLTQGLVDRPTQMHFVAYGASPEEVLDFARKLSLVLRKQGHDLLRKQGRDVGKFNPHRPAQKNTFATPILVIIDEGTHTDQVDKIKKAEDGGPVSTRETKELEKFLTSARHEHIALTWLIQAPTARSWRYMEQSNRFRIFRYVHEWGFNALRAAGIPGDEVGNIRMLAKFTFLKWDKDSPWEITYLALPDPEETANENFIVLPYPRIEDG